jgi:hypothetical protein
MFCAAAAVLLFTAAARVDFHSAASNSASVPLTPRAPPRETKEHVARYSNLLGCSIQVQYRAGVILLSASGTLVADTGRSIFLEQHLEQRGKIRYFRWEIPYQYIVRLTEKSSSAHVAESGTAVAEKIAEPAIAVPSPANSMAAAAGSSADTANPSSGGPTLLPLQNHSKTA